MSEITDKMVISMAKALGHEGVYVNGKTIRRALTAALQAAEAQPLPSPEEKKAQASRCSCRGVDDYCPCQNVADRETVRQRQPTAGQTVACKHCQGRGTEADWVGDDMRCIEAECSFCSGSGFALAPTPSHSLEEARRLALEEAARIADKAHAQCALSRDQAEANGNLVITATHAGAAGASKAIAKLIRALSIAREGA